MTRPGAFSFHLAGVNSLERPRIRGVDGWILTCVCARISLGRPGSAVHQDSGLHLAEVA